ncbi:LuxR C-terminal-related transcriptional regulator [Sphingobacterium sp. HMA12]|uniref:helix-turn-helix transcriptional regulator n=1 Tax=Sphingobacterium sp. HMA12 TaxID=2050894 RepID=UPI0013154DD2|nr:LuxR C-terminal-related transcriptional regulator [Sphingobacterium sp. HMA12]
MTKADGAIDDDPLTSLEYAKQANIMVEDSKDSERKAEAYFYIARSLNILEEYEKSYPYIDKGLAESSVNKNKTLKSNLLQLKSHHYSRLHLYKQQAKQDQEILDLTLPGQSPESMMIAALSLASLGNSYTLIGDYKSAHRYGSMAIEQAQKVPDSSYRHLKKIYKTKAYLNYYKAMMYIEQFNPTSALPFIKIAFAQAQIDNKPLTLFLEIYGDYYTQTGDIKKAIAFYLDAVADKRKRTWDRSTSSDLYLKISKSYSRVRQIEEEEKYLKLSSAARLIDENKNRVRVQAVLDNIEKSENEATARENRSKLIFIVSLSVILLILAWKYHQFKRKKTKLISAKENEIEEKKQMIETLELKVNESFSELIQLAKKNSPVFWARFQEVHPRFLKQMLSIDTNFKSTELILCAYIYLGFSTKEIADYTFKATKTIENNRYNLRKKLGLSPEEDLIIWIRGRVDESDN